MGQSKQEFQAEVKETLCEYGQVVFVNAPQSDLSPIMQTANELGADCSYVLRQDGKAYRVTIAKDK